MWKLTCSHYYEPTTASLAATRPGNGTSPDRAGGAETIPHCSRFTRPHWRSWTNPSSIPPVLRRFPSMGLGGEGHKIARCKAGCKEFSGNSDNSGRGRKWGSLDRRNLPRSLRPVIRGQTAAVRSRSHHPIRVVTSIPQGTGYVSPTRRSAKRARPCAGRWLWQYDRKKTTQRPCDCDDARPRTIRPLPDPRAPSMRVRERRRSGAAGHLPRRRSQ